MTLLGEDRGESRHLLTVVFFSLDVVGTFLVVILVVVDSNARLSASTTALSRHGRKGILVFVGSFGVVHSLLSLGTGHIGVSVGSTERWRETTHLARRAAGEGGGRGRSLLDDQLSRRDW